MKILLLMCVLCITVGCSSTKYVYLKPGEKIIVFVPNVNNGVILNYEVEAPKYEEE